MKEREVALNNQTFENVRRSYLCGNRRQIVVGDLQGLNIEDKQFKQGQNHSNFSTPANHEQNQVKSQHQYGNSPYKLELKQNNIEVQIIQQSQNLSFEELEKGFHKQKLTPRKQHLDKVFNQPSYWATISSTSKKQMSQISMQDSKQKSIEDELLLKSGEIQLFIKQKPSKPDIFRPYLNDHPHLISLDNWNNIYINTTPISPTRQSIKQTKNRSLSIDEEFTLSEKKIHSFLQNNSNKRNSQTSLSINSNSKIQQSVNEQKSLSRIGQFNMNAEVIIPPTLLDTFLVQESRSTMKDQWMNKLKSQQQRPKTATQNKKTFQSSQLNQINDQTQIIIQPPSPFLVQAWSLREQQGMQNFKISNPLFTFKPSDLKVELSMNRSFYRPVSVQATSNKIRNQKISLNIHPQLAARLQHQAPKSSEDFYNRRKNTPSPQVNNSFSSNLTQINRSTNNSLIN